MGRGREGEGKCCHVKHKETFQNFGGNPPFSGESTALQVGLLCSYLGTENCRHLFFVS